MTQHATCKANGCGSIVPPGDDFCQRCATNKQLRVNNLKLGNDILDLRKKLADARATITAQDIELQQLRAMR